VFAPSEDSLCLASGAAIYRIDANATSADFTIKVVDDSRSSDLRIQRVENPELADLVLVDDGAAHGPEACRQATPVRTVAFHTGPASPDVTVRLSADEAADYKIYVRSTRFSQQDAAALLAAMWKANQRGEVTGSIR
jgi:hypothetical protein